MHNEQHNIQFDKLLNDLNICARKRTLSFFSSFSSLSSIAKQGIQRFFSVGRKEWVHNVYIALNNMKDPNKLEDVKELLEKLEKIEIAEKNKKEEKKEATSSIATQSFILSVINN